MSIADKLTSIENHLTDDYNALTRLGADLTNVDKNIENIADVCDAIYNATPKVTDTGSNLTLTPTRKGRLTIVPKGACEQEGTPTPDSPIAIKVVTGENIVTISNSDNSESQEITVDLKTIELCKIGDYQDYIYGTKDNWKLVKQIGKVVYTGDKTENWLYNATNQVFTLADNVSYKFSIFIPYANYFKGKASITGYSQLNNNEISFLNNIQQQNRIVIKSLSQESQNAFKTWLSTHNTTVYYLLAESTETTIEDEDIIDDLNDLYDAMGYDGTTNISITSSNAQMIAQVSALKGE